MNKLIIEYIPPNRQRIYQTKGRINTDKKISF